MKLRLLVLAAALAACGGDSREPASPPPPAAPPPAVEIQAASSDAGSLGATARKLAGLAADGDPVWARHAELMAPLWQELETRHLHAMRSWAEDRLELADPQAPLFYPFSGPDLPGALQFFPRAASYVLVGLEPPGRIPDLAGLGDAELAAELERLRGGMESLVEAGYFVTRKMESDFVSPHLEGVLPALYIFLARAGWTPEAVHFVGLDAEGRAEPLAAVTDRSATAVRLAWHDGERPRTLYYFAQDLSNRGLAAAPAFVAFLRSLGAFSVYMKSASYLSHMEDFTALKELLLSRAGTVLQDDSGVPLRDFSAERWGLRFFGTYTRTLPTYREWFQDDLRAVFEDGGVEPLPFAIGYHSQIGGSCLIWAQRHTG